jgi:hypothetical protein
MSTDNPITLSPSARATLEAAAHHPERLAQPPAMPTAARNAVLRSLERAGLIEKMEAQGEVVVFRATEAGLAAVTSPATAASPAAAAGPPTAPPMTAQARQGLRAAAEALVAAWEARSGLDEAVGALRACLSRKAHKRAAVGPRTPRLHTKQAKVLALLGRAEGATIAQVVEITGWAQHTVRGFLAGLKKKGDQVEVLERVKQVGSGNQGAKGSYSIYRLAGATSQAEAG